MKFPWGKVIETFDYNFDGQIMTVVKYHPWTDGYCKRFSPELVEYSCEEISQSAESLFSLIIAWMVYRKLGSNQQALTSGICRMLKLED